MARYFVTHQSAVYSCGVITVTMTSHTPQHLWLLLATQPPRIVPRRERRLNNTVPHQNNHNLYIDQVIEQQEPGDTTTHTFNFDWPSGAQVIFFYAINMGIQSIKATRTPIFAYQLKYTPLVTETWSKPGVPDLPWQFNNAIQGYSRFSGGGQLTILNNGFTGATAVLNMADLDVVLPPSLCDLAITTQFTSFMRVDDFDRYARISASIWSLSGPDRRDPHIDTFRDTPPCPNVSQGFIGSQLDNGLPVTMMLGPANAIPFTPCGLAIPTVPDPYLHHIVLEWEGGGPGQPLPYIRATQGPVVISTVAGQLEDVSDKWRKLRLQPILR